MPIPRPPSRIRGTTYTLRRRGTRNAFLLRKDTIPRSRDRYFDPEVSRPQRGHLQVEERRMRFSSDLRPSRVRGTTYSSDL